MKKRFKNLKRRLEYFFKSRFYLVTNAQALLLGLRHTTNHQGFPYDPEINSAWMDIYGNLWAGSEPYYQVGGGPQASLKLKSAGFDHFGNLEPEVAEKVGYRSVWVCKECNSPARTTVKGAFFYDKSKHQ